MLHGTVEPCAGRSDEQKRRIADAVTRVVVAGAGVSGASISVAIEDVAPADRVKTVHRPDIVAEPGAIVKPPGHGPL